MNMAKEISRRNLMGAGATAALGLMATGARGDEAEGALQTSHKVTKVPIGQNGEALRAQHDAHAKAEGAGGWELVQVNFYSGADHSIWYWKQVKR
jgi:hypothetical protein